MDLTAERTHLAHGISNERRWGLPTWLRTAKRHVQPAAGIWTGATGIRDAGRADASGHGPPAGHVHEQRTSSTTVSSWGATSRLHDV